MDEKTLREFLNDFKAGRIKLDDALQKLKLLPFEDLGFVKIDHHRALRKGFPEVVFCQNKTKEQVTTIIKKLSQNNSDVIATRATKEMFESVKKAVKDAEYNEISGTIFIKKSKGKKANRGKIIVLSAGTSDMKIAEEAATVAEVMGNDVERIYDVGVAGLHRLLGSKDKVDEASIAIVVAGMDGVLPSVVGGIFSKPVIAVPTSVGYGAAFNGIAPLLTMLNSCSPGVVVVNIDNGFGAGYFASIINGLGKE